MPGHKAPGMDASNCPARDQALLQVPSSGGPGLRGRTPRVRGQLTNECSHQLPDPVGTCCFLQKQLCGVSLTSLGSLRHSGSSGDTVDMGPFMEPRAEEVSSGKKYAQLTV